MAIRLRLIDNQWIAICAARSVPKEGDVYIDDGQHEALSNKFSRDFNSMFDMGLTGVYDDNNLVEQEESNNPSRTWWDQYYGADIKTKD